MILISASASILHPGKIIPCAQHSTHLPEARLNNRAPLKIICSRFTFYSRLFWFNCQSHRIIAGRRQKALLELGIDLEARTMAKKKWSTNRAILKLFKLCCCLRSVSLVFMESGRRERAAACEAIITPCCRFFFTKLIAQVRGSLTIISCSFA